MSQHGRRTFLKLSGGVLGGIFAGSTVTAAERTDRFIVDTTQTSPATLQAAGLELDHVIEQVDLAVVFGAESDLKSTRATYEPDLSYTLEKPRDGTLEAQYEVDNESPGNGKGKGTGGGTASDSTVDESLYPLQWDKQAQDLSSAHHVTKGEGSRVAIIDSGVYADHPDLDVNLELSRNFTGDGEGAGVPAGDDHGTHVAGTVAASDNGSGVIGTAPAAEVVDCRVFSYAPGASFGDILAAVAYSAAIDADVANLSLGAYPVPREGIGGFYGKSLNRVMTYANNEGTLLVIAAGNDTADLQHDGGFISLPNEGAQAVSVAATGPVGFGWGDDGLESPVESPAFYTNYGTNAITLGAPGGDADLEATGTGVPWYNDLVLSTTADVSYEYDTNGNPIDYLDAEPTYGWKAGTSMAAPQVAGAAALVKSANPSYNAGQVESALKGAAEVPDGYDKAYYGSGFLNVVDAL